MTRKFMIILFVAMLMPLAAAELTLDNIYFDPAVIVSGDEVDIVIEFHDNATPASLKSDPNRYRFQVTLMPDDSISEQYVTILDEHGDDLKGVIYTGNTYNKKFRVKISNNAPASTYEFRLVGQWFIDGVPEGGAQFLRFKMDVKRVGIALSVSNLVSDPAKVRAGDKEVLVTATVFNTGEKTARNVNMRLEHPEGMSSSYSNNNELTLGVLEAQQSRDVQFYLDTDYELKQGTYAVKYFLDYQDIDGNDYAENSTFMFTVKAKPYLIVVNSTGIGLVGRAAELKVTVMNIGEETADSVDIRIVKQSSQPFEMDVRSDFLGQIKPGEQAQAIFKITALRDAEIKEHQFTTVIRARGDSDAGNDGIYIYTDSATLDIVGKPRNLYPYVGLALALVIIIIWLISKRK